MTILPCTMEDVDVVAAFYDKVTAYLAEHVNYPHWRHKEYPSLAYVAAMTRSGGQYLLKENDRVVGAFVLNDDPQGAYEVVPWHTRANDNAFAVLHALAIDPSAYGQGLAKQAVDFCIGYARQKGYVALRLDVVPTNTPARCLYEGMGFDYIGDYDLMRGYDDIPLFSMYELDLSR